MFAETSVTAATRTIRENGYFMNKAIEAGSLREALRHADSMLSELRIDSCTPREYYKLFSLMFDMMAPLHQFISSELRKKPKMALYDTVQFSKSIVPRMYLMIVVGSVYIEQNTKPCMEVIKDLFKYLKGVQHPLRGLFARYYFVKVMKERFEEREDEIPFEDIASFYLENLKEMNNLWIRLNLLLEDKDKRKEQRTDLAITVGENLLRLSALEGMTVEVFKESVLERVIEIILENEDRISQEYLFDILISTFPDEYPLETLDALLLATEKLSRKVNLASIYIKLMERLTTFAKNNPNATSSLRHVYDSFRTTLSRILGKDKYKLSAQLNLLAAFMDFTVHFFSDNRDLIDEILKMAMELIGRYDEMALSERGVSAAIVQIITHPMKKLSLLILKLREFHSLVGMVESEKKKVAIEICSAIRTTRTPLVTPEICREVLSYLDPLFDRESSEEEVRSIANVLLFVDSGKPAASSQMLSLFAARCSEENPLHLQMLFPVLNRMQIKFLAQAAHPPKPLKLENCVYLSPQELESLTAESQADAPLDLEETFTKLLGRCSSLELEFPVQAFQLYIECLVAADLFGPEDEVDDIVYHCASKALLLIETDLTLSEDNVFQFRKLLAVLGQLRRTSSPIIEQLLSLMKASITLTPSKQDQIKSMLVIARAFQSNQLDDKVKESVQRTLSIIQQDLRRDKTNAIALVEFYDFLNECTSQNTGLFEEKELGACLEFINKQCKELDEEKENGPEISKRIRAYSERVTKFWADQKKALPANPATEVEVQH